MSSLAPAEWNTATPLERRPWGAAALQVLQAPKLKRELLAMLRRRVPAAEVEDLLQNTLCEALAAAHAPSDPAEVARWVMGIARHKIADYHRRAKHREQVCDAVDSAVLHDPIEDKLLLAEILRSMQREPAAHRALGWVAREVAGERLHDIAAQEALSPEVVRQRVSRLKKRLRARWLCAAALLGVLGAVVAAQHQQSSSASLSASRWALPAASPPASAPAPAPARESRSLFRVVELHLPPLLELSLGEWADAEARGTEVHWSGHEVTVVTPTRRFDGRLTLAPVSSDLDLGQLELSDGRTLPLQLRRQGPRTSIELLDQGQGSESLFAGGRVVIEPAD